MIPIDLSEEEKVILRQYVKTSPISLIRLKAQTILLRDHEMKVEDMAYAVGKSERTIERYIKDFSNKRIASIFSGLIGNEHAAKLNHEQKEEIKEVLKKEPSIYGLPKEFWDVPQLKTYVYARFGEVYETERSYHFLLEFGNLSFHYPSTFNFRRNDGQIAKRMEEIYGEILPLMEDPSWEVFCSDEVMIEHEAITRRCWLKKGERTVLKVEKHGDKQNYLGFLSQKTYKCHVIPIIWGRLSEIIKATEEFIKLYPNKKICIIWDNATCHKGELLRKALSRGGSLERVHLIPLPPYAPDYNPIEHVWNTVKDDLSNEQSAIFEITKQKFLKRTNNQFFHYQI